MKMLDIALEDIGTENIDIEDIDTEQFVVQLDSIELKVAAFSIHHCQPQNNYFIRKTNNIGIGIA